MSEVDVNTLLGGELLLLNHDGGVDHEEEESESGDLGEQGRSSKVQYGWSGNVEV